MSCVVAFAVTVSAQPAPTPSGTGVEVLHASSGPGAIDSAAQGSEEARGGNAFSGSGIVI